MPDETIAQGKANPLNLTLRAAPAPVTRFNRRILTALLGIAATAVFGALFYSLGLRHDGKPAATELFGANQPVSDRLNALPSTYSDIPQPKPAPPPTLGPPLPADLGHPLPATHEPENGPSRSGTDDPSAREAEQARVSKVFFGMSGTAGIVSPAASAIPLADQSTTPPTTSPALPPLDTDAAQNQQDRKRAFLQARPGESSSRRSARVRPASPYLVTAGSAIRAALVTAVNSDLPGLAEAQVTENVCDSVTGRYLLIPQGAKLIGEVDSQISYGQERLLAAWTQIEVPDGSTLCSIASRDRILRAPPGSTPTSTTIPGNSSRASSCSSLLGISTELAANSGTQNNDRIIVATRDSANDSINQAGQRITQKELAIQPTLTREAGYPFAVLVAKDLVLRPLGPC